MKFKAIIAAAMTLALAAGALEMADIKSGTTAFAENAETYEIIKHTSIGFSPDKSKFASGNVSISTRRAVAGEQITVTATAAHGCEIVEFFAYDYYAYPYSSTYSYTFTMPAHSVDVGATFDFIPTPEPTPTPTTPTTPTEPTTPPESTAPTEPTVDPITTQYKKGDVNLDGNVNAKDATLVLKHSVELIKLTGQGYINADVNGDGYINAKDATEILKMSVGLA